MAWVRGDRPLTPAQFFPSGKPNLTVMAVRDGAAQILQVKGEVDTTTAWRIDAGVMGILPSQAGRGPVIVDLSGVGLFSAAGLTALLTARKLCDGLGGLRVVASTRSVMRLLEVTALSGELAIYPTLDEALASGS